MNSLKHYLVQYAKEDFREEYMEYLNKPNGECPYRDIDAVENKDVVFYNDLAKFLKKRLELEVKGPDESDNPFVIKLQDDQGVMYLTSDQFGFSAPRTNNRKELVAWNVDQYPYARYLSLKCDADKRTEKIKFVASCIYETRTIGGSFIWPKVKIGRAYQSGYNMRRGVNSYIEDRVDITLYEVSRFYEVYSPPKGNKSVIDNCKSVIENYKKDNPKSELFVQLDKDNENLVMYRWLSIFETFEGYVEKLKFESFMAKDKDGKLIKENDKYLIRDMASEDASTPLNIDKIKKIKDMNIARDMNIDMNRDPLFTLLKNVKECTESRSKAIEEVLNN